MDAILDQLVSSPRLFQYFEELTRITRAEQTRRERFYEEITPQAKWEFINGEVIMHSPATHNHVAVRERLARLIGTYVALHRLGFTGGEKVLVCFTRNDYEPDFVYFGQDKARSFERNQLHHPPPDFVLEVLSESTQRIDRGTKFADYAGHGVQEYWIVDPWAETLEQYLLQGGSYELAAKTGDGTVRSRAIEGFAMPVRAAFDDEENLRALRTILPA